MARIGELESSHGRRPGMAGALQVLRGDTERASQQVGNNPLAGYRRHAHAHAIEAAFALLDAVVRNSGLALDPDLTTTALIEAEIVQHPTVVDVALAMGNPVVAIAIDAPLQMSQSVMAPQRVIGL